MWFALGDFNEILNNQEKIGGRIRPEISFGDFRTMMRSCGFTDLKTIGNRFSWVVQHGNHQVECCLGRTMETSEWFTEYPNSETEFLEIGEYDHRPLVTYFSQDRYESKRRFRYDDRMTEKEGVQRDSKTAWNGNGQMQLLQVPLVQRLGRCRKHISR